MKTMTVIVREVLCSLLKEIFIKNNKKIILQGCSLTPIFFGGNAFVFTLIKIHFYELIQTSQSFVIRYLYERREVRGHVSVRYFLWRLLKEYWHPECSSVENVIIFKINLITDTSVPENLVKYKASGLKFRNFKTKLFIKLWHLRSYSVSIYLLHEV